MHSATTQPLRLTRIFFDVDDWRATLYVDDGSGETKFLPLRAVLERSSEVSNIERLVTDVESGRITLCEADAGVWGQWSAACA